jgi:hypothetical protein
MTSRPKRRITLVLADDEPVVRARIRYRGVQHRSANLVGNGSNNERSHADPLD